MTKLVQDTCHRETADYYQSEVWRDGRFRICECCDGTQWLFQRQRPGFPDGRARGSTLGHCRSCKGLLQLHRAHIVWEAAAIAAFPETFVRRRDQ